eukprot:3551842-Rhodomonas_salina.1
MPTPTTLITFRPARLAHIFFRPARLTHYELECRQSGAKLAGPSRSIAPWRTCAANGCSCAPAESFLLLSRLFTCEGGKHPHGRGQFLQPAAGTCNTYFVLHAYAQRRSPRGRHALASVARRHVRMLFLVLVTHHLHHVQVSQGVAQQRHDQQARQGPVQDPATIGPHPVQTLTPPRQGRCEKKRCEDDREFHEQHAPPHRICANVPRVHEGDGHEGP